MPKGKKQKFKLYYLRKIMIELTDDKHGLTIYDIMDKLAGYGVTVDRKTLYNDLKDTEELGIEIDVIKNGRERYYHVVRKKFELAELKLLVDAIQSSKFITLRKSNSLIKKLMGFASIYEAGELRRQVYVDGRIKSMNETIYYNVDAIHHAISDNCQIKFEYLKWNLNKELVPRRNEKYIVSPWGLAWFGENYYLVAFDGYAGIIKHFRVDKMRDISVLSDRRQGRKLFEQFDMAAYSNKNFGMFTGEEQSVLIRFINDYVGVIIDRFGRNINIRPSGDGYSETRVNVAISHQFYGWVISLAGNVTIAGPDDVLKDFVSYIRFINSQYLEK